MIDRIRKIHSSAGKPSTRCADRSAQPSGFFPGGRDIYHATWLDVLCLTVVTCLVVGSIALLAYMVALYVDAAGVMA